MSKLRYWGGIIPAIFLGMIFLVAGTGKLMLSSTSYNAYYFPEYLPEALTRALYSGLPYIEALIGFLLVLGLALRFTTAASFALVACFLASNLYLLSQGIGTCGSCFGVAGELSVYAALTLDAIMFILIAVTFICHKGNMTPWYLTGHTVTGEPARG